MNESQVTVFLPCRRGSVRVADKNVRPFGTDDESLLFIKLRQLEVALRVERVVVSSNDRRVLEAARVFSQTSPLSLELDERPDHLGSSSTRTDELIAYVPSVISAEHILWTHVTSPFFDAPTLDEMVSEYFSALEQGFDSLMTVNRIQKFIWDQNGPVNYDRDLEKWPRTQTLPVWWEVNSAAFLAPRRIYLEQRDRVGQRPKMFELSLDAAFDIDNLEEFELGRKLWASRSG